MLTSRSLSGALGVSSTPVRAALKRLEAAGVLVSKAKSAFFVKDPDQVDFKEILDIRLNLEGLAVREAARHATKKDLVQVRALNIEYERLVTAEHGGDESLIPNYEFHFKIYRLSGSHTLVELIANLWLRIGPLFHRYVSTRAKSVESPHYHHDIIQALASHNPDAAEIALRKDLLASYSEILPQLAPRLPAIAPRIWRTEGLPGKAYEGIGG